jgi:hypothetical protein
MDRIASISALLISRLNKRNNMSWTSLSGGAEVTVSIDLILKKVIEKNNHSLKPTLSTHILQ